MAIRPLNSVAGFSVGETPTTIILANGDIVTNNLTTLSGNMVFGAGGNSNIFTLTGTGSNVDGYITTTGDATIGGNLSVNNYIVTPIATNLVFAPDTGLSLFDSNVNPNANITYNLGNGTARWANVYANNEDLSGNLFVTDTANVGNLRTDNLLYANGQPWDLQEAAGSNTQVQYNDGLNNFGASANFTYDDSTRLLTVLGNIQSNNANLGNLAIANYVNVASNTITNNLTVNSELSGNTANFSGNVVTNNLTNNLEFQANTANFDGNVIMDQWLTVTDTANVGNLRTNNLLYANGQPWDLQEAAGSNTQIQYNDGLNNFGASANFTYDDGTQQFYVNGTASVTGNANIGNIGTGIITASGTVTGGNLATAGTLSAGGNANVGNLGTGGLITATGNIDGGNINTANAIVGNAITGNSVVNAGNLNVTNNVLSNLIPNATATYDLGNSSTTWGNVYAANFIGNISGNVSAPGANTDVIFNDNGISNAVANFTYDKTYNSGGGQLNVGNTVGGKIITDTFYASYANVNGNIDTSANINASGNISATGNVAANNANLSGSLSLTSATGNISLSGGNISGVNDVSANTGSFSNTVTTNDLTVNLNISGNTANFTGNITSLNANLGNLATANYINVANDINVLGNVNTANLVGPLANGTSNVKVYNNANVEVSIGGSANVATFSSTGLYVVGEINTTAGNMLSNGNVTANGFLNGANANVTGQVSAGSVLTANITAPTGNITISAAGSDQSINLSPTGNGTVDVGLHRITQVADPVDPHDAPTKEYVDNVAQGISVHPAVYVTSATNLNATYADGGTVLTTTTISGGKTITFSTNHGLSIGDEIYWSSSFNGITAYNAYFVYSTPATNQITIKDGFYGAEVTTLTNGTGLAQTAVANSGVGATLTNAGANAAIQIDSITLSATQRVLVQGQTNAYENGVYTVTTVGDGSTAWVLTRSSDTNTYDPKSATGLAIGDYFFVEQGLNYAGSSYVVTSPAGEIVFGYTNIGFTQFSAAGSYTAGSGIAITGTTISANVDLVTTDIVGGNIVVKASANLTTPNLGDATFSSLSWNNLSNGNVTANNLSTGNIANIGLDLTVGGLIQANGNISSNNWVNANDVFVTNTLSAQGNALVGNLTANTGLFAVNANMSGNTITNYLTVNNEITGNTANFSGNITVNNATVNLELSGNTANFSGNVTVNNETVNLELSGNTANFSGNVVVNGLTVNNDISGNTANFTGNINSALNANLGNLVTANYFTGTLINGTSNVAIPSTNGNVNITAGGNTTLVVTDTGANITGNLGVTGSFNVGTLEATNVKANTNLFVGNTTVTWGTLTTTSVTANQTIASFSVAGVTGVEFLVKGIDATGGKYSVGTVQAVTDGANVDWSIFGTVQLGGYTGGLAVNVSGGFIYLQVTPSSSNSTVWTTQYRLI